MRTGRPCARLRVARRRLVGRLHGLRLARAGLQHRGELPVFGGRVLRALAGAAGRRGGRRGRRLDLRRVRGEPVDGQLHRAGAMAADLRMRRSL